MPCVAVHFIACILRFEEVHKLEDVGRGAHPLRRIARIVMLRESEFFEPAVRDVLHVLVHVVGVEAEDAAREKVLVVSRLEVHAFDDDIAYLAREFRCEEVCVLLERRVDEVDAELEVKRFVAEDPIDEGAEITELVALAEAERHHEARVEPDAFHDDIGGDEIPDEIFFSLDTLNVKNSFRHAAHVLEDIRLLSFHRRRLEVDIEDLLALQRERLQDILERDAVVRLLPHLLRHIEVALRRLHVGVPTEGDGAVDDELGRIEERHEKLDGVPLVFGHLAPIFEVFLQRYLMREPCVANRLLVEVIRPLVANGVEIDV